MSDTQLKAFPKIFHLGTKYVDGLFNEPVEVTEKIDGSQFVFGKVGGQIKFRSKGAEIFAEGCQKMFRPGVETVLSMDLPEGLVFYCEYLAKPKHNVLAYQRTPTGGMALFGISDADRATMHSDHASLVEWAERLGIEAIPLIHSGPSSTDEVLAMLDRDSVLGGQKIEGVVVKNYKDCFIADRVYPVMAAKYVTEQFKEVHAKNWKGDHTGKGKWETFKERYCTEARWLKAVQHLRDDGTLTGEPRDIGALIQEVRRDITEEEQEAIKAFLWREFGDELLRRSTTGLPEWYKLHIARGDAA